MATLADVLKAIKDLITVTEKVRDNTERIAKLEEKVDKLGEKVDTGFKNVGEEIHTLHMDMVEMRGDIKVILTRLDMKEEISALKVQLAEHIAACEKVQA